MNRDNCPSWASCKWSVHIDNKYAMVVRRKNAPKDNKWYPTDVANEMVKSAPPNSGIWAASARGYRNKRAVEHAIFSLRAKFPDAEIIVRRWNKRKSTRQWWQMEWRFKPGMPIYKKP